MEYHFAMLADPEVVAESKIRVFDDIFMVLIILGVFIDKTQSLDVWEWWEDGVKLSVRQGERVDVVEGEVGANLEMELYWQCADWGDRLNCRHYKFS